MKLTERQRQIAALIVLGMPYKQIAFDLGVSMKTVCVHSAHIRRSLQLGKGLLRVHLREFFSMIDNGSMDKV